MSNRRVQNSDNVPIKTTSKLKKGGERNKDEKKKRKNKNKKKKAVVVRCTYEFHNS